MRVIVLILALIGVGFVSFSMTKTSNHAKNFIGSAKGYGGCSVCGGTWDWTEGHTVDYTEDGLSGTFTVCENCFWTHKAQELYPYYKAQFEKGRSYGENVEKNLKVCMRNVCKDRFSRKARYKDEFDFCKQFDEAPNV